MKIFPIILILCVIFVSMAYAQTSPSPLDLQDAGLPPVPVIAKAELEKASCFPGGNLVYLLTLTWSAPPDRQVVLKPFAPPQAQGVDLVDRSQKSSKSIQGDNVETRLSTRAIYRCVTPGKYELGPLTIPYNDGSGEELSTVAPAVTVEVRQGPLQAVRGSKPTKIVLFIGGLIAFWAVVFYRRRQQKRKSTAAAAALEAVRKEEADVWEAFAEEARQNPTGEFYARLEESLWNELFRPEPVLSGTTATRMAALTQAGMTEGILSAAREVINACQKARFTSGAVSQGDAIMAVRTVREKVLEPLRASRKLTEAVPEA